MLMIILSALAAIIPMTFYLYLIWKMDRFDREPLNLVLISFFWGAFGAVILALIGSIMLSSFIQFFIKDEFGFDFIGAVFIAPFVEEITKGIFLLITISNRKFDNLTDGIVYGGAIGLGFGMTENFLYFLSYTENLSDWISIVIIRSLFSGVMHLLSTSTLGAFLGLSKFWEKSLRVLIGFFGLGVAMIIHALWNFFVSFQITTFLGFIFMIFSIVVFILIFRLSVISEGKMILRELTEEVEIGLIPLKHLKFLSSIRRDESGWIDEEIKKPYIKNATTLAFRKRQLKNSRGYSKAFYQSEIDFYRNQIAFLLNQSRFQ